MSACHQYSFKKEERLCSRKLIDLLFSGKGSKSLAAFPLRAVYLEMPLQGEGRTGDGQVKILISVPKKHLRRAVERNRVKRQIREAYRKNKHLLYERLSEVNEKQLLIAFIWITNKINPTEQVERQLINLLQRMSERLE